MTRKVGIIGFGLTKFGEHWEKSFSDLVAEAGVKAVHDSGIDGKEIQAVYGATMASGRFIGQEHVGALIADQLGLNPMESTRIEAACASGGVALRNAYLAIKSGKYDLVAVGGVEKMTDVSTAAASMALGGAGDQETELFFGATFPALYALMATRYMHDFKATEEQMAEVAVKNHANAVHNEYAQFRKEITIEQVMKSGYIATPLKLLDCSPITDGAVVVILAEEKKARKLAEQPVEIIATEQASDTIALSSRKSLTELNATKEAARKAFECANVKATEVSFAEVHDCFTIAEILAIEDIGFFRKGQGAKATEDGRTRIEGEIPVNTSGGLKGDGHPVGATGIKQAVEAALQLQGKAGKRQVDNPEVGLTHNVGGSGATCVVGLYRKME